MKMRKRNGSSTSAARGPRERLILVNSNPAKTAPWRDALDALGYTVKDGYPVDGNLAPGVRHRLVAGPASRSSEIAREIDPLWARAAAQFESVAETALRSARPPLYRPADAERLPDPADLEGSAGDAETFVRPGVDGAGREVARLAGSAVHAALEGWEFDGAESLRSLARRAAQRLVESTPAATNAPGLDERVKGEVQEIVERFIASPLPERLAGVEILGREVTILFRDEDDRVWNGSCDLVYRDGEGRVVAADYKTERLDGDAAAAAQRHRPQIAIYVEALRRAMPDREIRGEVIFVRGGVAVPLD